MAYHSESDPKSSFDAEEEQLPLDPSISNEPCNHELHTPLWRRSVTKDAIWRVVALISTGLWILLLGLQASQWQNLKGVECHNIQEPKTGVFETKYQRDTRYMTLDHARDYLWQEML